MKRTIALLLATLVSQLSAQVVLDDFNTGTATGAEIGGTSWVGQTTLNGTTLTVGGTAKDENGWGTTSVNVNATGMNYLVLAAQLDVGNAAPFFAIQFEDSALSTHVMSVTTSSFLVGSMSTVYVAIGAWTGGFDITQITGWTIGGGNPAAPNAFRMTFDNIALSATGAPVPEPSTYAMIAGVLALGFVAWRRRSVSV